MEEGGRGREQLSAPSFPPPMDLRNVTIKGTNNLSAMKGYGFHMWLHWAGR